MSFRGKIFSRLVWNQTKRINQTVNVLQSNIDMQLKLIRSLVRSLPSIRRGERERGKRANEDPKEFSRESESTSRTTNYR